MSTARIFQRPKNAMQSGRARTDRWVAGMRQLAAEVSALARAAFPDIDDHGLDALLAGHDMDAHAQMLPAHWFSPAQRALEAAGA